ncbi:MAG: twin-arginine translocase TatA/TatE family subunit [Micrococcaceae bacterium]
MRVSFEHVLIVLVVALVVFGAPRLPGVVSSIGQSLRIFKSEVREMKREDQEAKESAKESSKTNDAGEDTLVAGEALEVEEVVVADTAVSEAQADSDGDGFVGVSLEEVLAKGTGGSKGNSGGGSVG